VKVFCIGFNKTGTTSLHEYFVRAGLNSKHDALYQKHTRTLPLDELRAYLDAHEAYTDGERANYVLLLELYPDAKFVLNTRELKKWLESRVKHVFRQGGAALAEPADEANPQPGFWAGGMAREYLNDSERAISDWIDRREFYHRHVMHFFAATKPEALRLVNVSTDVDWQSELDEFLGLSASASDVPEIHANVASADMNAHAMHERLQQIEAVLVQKNVPRSEWDTETYIGFNGAAGS
jgi:hypothetical protein